MQGEHKTTDPVIDGVGKFGIEVSGSLRAGMETEVIAEVIQQNGNGPPRSLAMGTAAHS